MNFNILECEPGRWWSDLVENSSQGSIFNSVIFLDSLGVSYKLHKVMDKRGRIVAGFSILDGEYDGLMATAPYPCTPYQGILFDRSLADLKNYRRISLELKISQEIINWLSVKYKNISMSLSPSFNDIRPFIWHNYDNSILPKFSIQQKYTAILDLNNFSLQKYLLSIREVRRQEYKKTLNLDVENISLSDFQKIYIDTFRRQGIDLSESYVKKVIKVCESSINNGFGAMKMIKINNIIASATLIVHDKLTAYYLFGANNPAFRNSGASTQLMIKNICMASELGCKYLDFVGVNSPNRGDYKLSFNGKLTPYFQVSLF